MTLFRHTLPPTVIVLAFRLRVSRSLRIQQLLQGPTRLKWLPRRAQEGQLANAIFKKIDRKMEWTGTGTGWFLPQHGADADSRVALIAADSPRFQAAIDSGELSSSHVARISLRNQEEPSIYYELGSQPSPSTLVVSCLGGWTASGSSSDCKSGIRRYAACVSNRRLWGSAPPGRVRTGSIKAGYPSLLLTAKRALNATPPSVSVSRTCERCGPDRYSISPQPIVDHSARVIDPDYAERNTQWKPAFPFVHNLWFVHKNPVHLTDESVAA